MRTARCSTLLVGLVVFFSVEAEGADFFVAPGPGPGGNGSIDRPWSLTFALSHPPDVKPGDTIWLRGGTYVGTFLSNLTGTSASPIKVRQYPGERATLDGNAVTTLAVAMNASTTSCTLAAGIFASDPMNRGATAVRI